MKAFDLTGPLPTGTTVIEASAGTGKTFALATLATRYLAEGCPLDKLLVITFSRAATAELRSRIAARLDEAVALCASDDPSDDPLAATLREGERDAKLARLLESQLKVDEINVATTHEFCERALRRLGQLADAGPVLHFVEDATGVALEVATDLYLSRFGDQERPALSWSDAQYLAHQCVQQADVDLAPSPGSVRVEFAQAVREEVERRKQLAGIRTFDDVIASVRDVLVNPHTAEAARERLSDAYRVVLVDEFQDTDPAQWEILRRAFHGKNPLILIGDPKQAIYAFRGADVFTYLAAREEADLTATLGANFRSSPALVKALGTVWGRAELGDERIHVRPVEAAATELHLPPSAGAPLQIRIPRLNGPASVGDARRHIYIDLVAQISRQLAHPPDICVHGHTRALGPGDIAVLVDSNANGAKIRDLLVSHRIPAAFAGANSVLKTSAATEWLFLLQALEAGGTRELRRAATTNLLGVPLGELGGRGAGALAQLEARRRRWREVLTSHGIHGLFSVVAADQRLYPRLLGTSEGERQIADLRHVVDLLGDGGPDLHREPGELASWLLEKMSDTNSAQEQSRRLETEADTVQVMTVHRSKGLQFPVVYLPFAGMRYNEDLTKKRSLTLCDPLTGRRTLNVEPASETWRAHAAAAEQEEAGEELRKLYVGLTRAQFQAVCWWYPTHRNLSTSALHRVLFHDVGSGHVARDYPCDMSPLDVARLHDGEGIDVAIMPPTPQPLEHRPHSRLAEVPALRQVRRQWSQGWRRTSYSGLTQGATHESGLPGDDEPEVSSVVPLAGAQQPSAFADLPGGTTFGTFIHSVFEVWDTDAHDPLSSLDEAISQTASRLGALELDTPALHQAMASCVQTDLGPLAGHRRLRDIASADRLPELDFDLPLGTSGASTLADICTLMERHLPSTDPVCDYPARLRASLTEDGASLVNQELRGYLTGSIDALLRIDDRYVVVDYKTNRLAPPDVPLTLGHYHPTLMAEAMMASHYPLQALLYAVATHRFLRWRLPGYDPHRHLGGALYLFVRGMAGPETAPRVGYGVFEWSIPADLVVDVSAAVEGRS